MTKEFKSRIKKLEETHVPDDLSPQVIYICSYPDGEVGGVIYKQTTQTPQHCLKGLSPAQGDSQQQCSTSARVRYWRHFQANTHPTDLIKSAIMEHSGLSRKNTIKTLDDHTGTRTLGHQYWTVSRADKNASIYQLNWLG